MSLAILSRQFNTCAAIIRRNLEGISEEQALIVPDRGGSNIHWIVGHVVASRDGGVQARLGGEPVWSKDERARFGRGTTPQREASPSLTTMLDVYERTHRATMDFLRDLDPARLSEPLAEPHPVLGNTVGELLATLAFHEAYHIGQIGVLRRLMGLGAAVP